ncbi:HipA N-terminal domain-containing protein [Alteromonas sp. S005]|uniref:HipA N-terminal domain-containing protein n=1 Tax=Alteromonas sp. S005 TaxID=3117400 RepID=UPI002FE2E6FF
MGELSAEVFLYDVHVGILKKHPKGYSFKYKSDYFGPPLSLSLPLRASLYESDTLFPFFKSLLPEGWLLKQYARAQRIDERDEFSLLVNNGEDLLGAVAIKSIEENE